MPVSVLSRSQQAIARMVSDSINFSWTSYNNEDRSSARSILLRRISAAPERLSERDWSRMMEGKGQKRTKDYLRSLHDALQDDIWKML